MIVKKRRFYIVDTLESPIVNRARFISNQLIGERGFPDWVQSAREYNGSLKYFIWFISSLLEPNEIYRIMNKWQF